MPLRILVFSWFIGLVIGPLAQARNFCAIELSGYSALDGIAPLEAQQIVLLDETHPHTQMYFRATSPLDQDNPGWMSWVTERLLNYNDQYFVEWIVVPDHRINRTHLQNTEASDNFGAKWEPIALESLPPETRAALGTETQAWLLRLMSAHSLNRFIRTSEMTSPLHLQLFHKMHNEREKPIRHVVYLRYLAEGHVLMQPGFHHDFSAHSLGYLHMINSGALEKMRQVLKSVFYALDTKRDANGHPIAPDKLEELSYFARLPIANYLETISDSFHTVYAFDEKGSERFEQDISSITRKEQLGRAEIAQRCLQLGACDEELAQWAASH